MDDLMTSGTKIVKIITVSPTFQPVNVRILYIAYNGWITDGKDVWRVDKISIKEGKTGDYLSHCKTDESETILRSGIVSDYLLMLGDCTLSDTIQNQKIHSNSTDSCASTSANFE